MKKDKTVVGAIEKVNFPKFGMADITAKIDTGAYTGALHCTKIEEEKTKTSKTLRFSPFDHPEIVITTHDYRSTHVRSSNGGNEKRFVIQTNIVIRRKKYPITLSLANRSAMKWPVLIGRRFLKHNNLLVDVSVRNK